VAGHPERSDFCRERSLLSVMARRSHKTNLFNPLNAKDLLGGIQVCVHCQE
jgi:hypothetical protein